MNASLPPADSLDARVAFYRAIRRDPKWALEELVPEAMGTLRSLASMDHGACAQRRAAEAVARIDAAVAEKLGADDAT